MRGYNRKKETEREDADEALQPTDGHGAVAAVAAGRHVFCRRGAGRRENAVERAGICRHVRKIKNTDFYHTSCRKAAFCFDRRLMAAGQSTVDSRQSSAALSAGMCHAVNDLRFVRLNLLRRTARSLLALPKGGEGVAPVGRDG